MTAAKILLTTPPKRKEFRYFSFNSEVVFVSRWDDFNGTICDLLLIGFVLTAVFLVAQYARYEIRRMEAELEEKKRKEEEERPESELSKVITRLGALEAAVKIIVDEKAKIPSSLSSKDRQVDPKGQVVAADKQFDTQNRSPSTKDQQVDPQRQVVAAGKQFDTQNQAEAGEDTTISKKEQVSGSGHSSYIAALNKEGKGSVGATSGKSTN